MNAHVIAHTTYADADQAAATIDAVLADRLAACVQVQPITSHYVWHGEVRHHAEVLVTFKTRAARVGELRRRVVELHPYETPEFMVVDVVDGHHPYLAWIDEQTSPRA